MWPTALMLPDVSPAEQGRCGCAGLETRRQPASPHGPASSELHQLRKGWLKGGVLRSWQSGRVACCLWLSSRTHSRLAPACRAHVLWRVVPELQPRLGWASQRHLCRLLLLQVKQALGLKGLFVRGPKPGSLDSHAAGQPPPRPSVSQRLLRRTASAPTKSQKPGRRGFPELALGTQDTGSEGAADDVVPPTPGPAPEALVCEGPSSSSPRGKASVERSPGQVRPPCAREGPGPAGMAATCMKCVVGSCSGVDAEGLPREQLPSLGPAGGHAAISQQPQARADLLGGPRCNLGPQATPGGSKEACKGPGARQQGLGGSSSVSSDSSSPDIPGSPKVAPCQPEGARRQLGALQGEMNALFVQKLEELRSDSPMFSVGKASCSRTLSVPRHAGPVSLPCCPGCAHASAGLSCAPSAPAPPLQMRPWHCGGVGARAFGSPAALPGAGGCMRRLCPLRAPVGLPG